MLSYHDQELTDIQRSGWNSEEKSAFKEVEKPDPEPQDRAVMVLKIIEGFGLIKVGIKGFESSKQQEAGITGEK